jgi:hypothetical protein
MNSCIYLWNTGFDNLLLGLLCKAGQNDNAKKNGLTIQRLTH